MVGQRTDLVVIGAGPGGYTAAFYAADKGKKVILIEKDEKLGGVCLNRGCIPSKALLHASALIKEARESNLRGISFSEPKIDLSKLCTWKDSIIEKMAKGVEALAKKRGVEVIKGRGYFEDSKILRVDEQDGQSHIHYEEAIIAVGSRPAIPEVFDLGNKRIMTSTEALEVDEIPQDLLVVGGGYIGMELSTVYATLGSRVVMVEALGSILTGADPDLVRYVRQHAEKIFKEIRVNTKVLKMAAQKDKIRVEMEISGHNKEELYDKVLISVGRKPNCQNLGLENTGIELDDKGFIKVNEKQQTQDQDIYAIGDVVGGAMLAHKASKEARVAVEAMIGEMGSIKDAVIPAVVFTDPEIAWCGLTETEAKEKGIAIRVARFPWSASGRALSIDRPDGLTKLIIEPKTERILGVGIVGVHAGELISEGVLAVEMAATVKDIAEIVHPHPTFSETIMESADVYLGYSTHSMVRRVKPAHEN